MLELNFTNAANYQRYIEFVCSFLFYLKLFLFSRLVVHNCLKETLRASQIVKVPQIPCDVIQ